MIQVTYPEIYYPDFHRKWLQDTFDNKFYKPEPFDIDKERQTIDKPKPFLKKLPKIILIFIFSLLPLIPLVMYGSNTFQNVYVGVVCVFCVLFTMNFFYDNIKNYLDYKGKVREEENRLDSLKKQFDRDLFELDKWKTVKIHDKLELEKKKRECIAENLALIELPISKNDSNDIFQGASERKFANYLSSFYPEKVIFDDYEFVKEVKDGYYVNIPDIIYFNKETNFGVIIEIDEPYTFKGYRGKVPIHYLRNLEGFGLQNIDEERNKNFIEKNWVVIRFAEEQVVKQPTECIGVIDNILNKFQEPLPKRNDKIGKLDSVKKWHYEDSLKMVERQYREKYLNVTSKLLPISYTPFSQLSIENHDIRENKNLKRTEQRNETFVHVNFTKENFFDFIGKDYSKEEEGKKEDESPIGSLPHSDSFFFIDLEGDNPFEKGGSDLPF